MIALIDGVEEAGQHLVLFGERGVGKTSLAAVTSGILSLSAMTVRVNCQAGDTFSSVWKRAFQELTITTVVDGVGFGSDPKVTVQSALEALNLPDNLIADDVRSSLAVLSVERAVVIFFDEFDRMTDADVHRAFADTIKTLSDQGVAATIVIVGVADDVNGLITEHASVERALAQISMPRMSAQELGEIVDRGLESINFTIEPSARRRITRLSQGLPHYTHLLGQQAAMTAAFRESTRVENDDISTAISNALQRTQESIADNYYAATYSTRQTNMYPEVLLACAVTRADDRGYFSAAAVRDSLSEILGRRMEIPQFAGHLNAFSSDRGPILRKEGVQRNFRYRFRNPLMQPYVLMRGVKDELIKPTLLDRI